MNRRLEERIDYFARVQISYQLDGGRPTTASGVMEDRSKSGFAVRVARPIPVGSEVAVSHGANTFRCEIRRCIPSGVEFLLGLLVLPASNDVAE